jgi:hypothetical protein
MEAELQTALDKKESLDAEMNQLKDDIEYEELILAEGKDTMSPEEKKS